MKALLLSAGLGTRLRPITDTIPKCLVPINGKPLLEIWLENLVKSGITSILVNLHYFSEQVVHFLNNSPYGKYVQTAYEPTLLGTGGTLLENKSFLSDDSILLAHADNLTIFDPAAFNKSHRKRPEQCEMTMMTFETDTPQSCGIVELTNKGVVCAFHEKVKNPPGNLANGAVYILEPSIFSFLESLNKEIIDFSTEVLPHFSGKIFTFHNPVYHRDIGTVESYEKAQKDFENRVLSYRHDKGEK